MKQYVRWSNLHTVSSWDTITVVHCKSINHTRVTQKNTVNKRKEKYELHIEMEKWKYRFETEVLWGRPKAALAEKVGRGGKQVLIWPPQNISRENKNISHENKNISHENILSVEVSSKCWSDLCKIFTMRTILHKVFQQKHFLWTKIFLPFV